MSTSPQATGSTSHSIKLPKLVLKKFSGDPKTLQEWWDSFKVAVHENGISDVEKFNHLRSLVEDAVHATIAVLSLTEENYKTAIDLLQERFAQKQIFINSDMDAISKLSSVTSMADIKKIRQIYDQVEITSHGNENTVLFIDAKTSVLLQTAKIFVSRTDDPNHHIQARLIFDTGSQRSYVSPRLRNALQLPTINQETLMIKTFGSETGQIQSRDLVQLCVQGMTSETYLYVNAYAVPICSPLQNQAVNFVASTYEHLSGLLLGDSISADENENDVEVDVLIGADYYWHFLTGTIKRGERGPTALQTKVGWALSGPVQGGSALK